MNKQEQNRNYLLNCGYSEQEILSMTDEQLENEVNRLEAMHLSREEIDYEYKLDSIPTDPDKEEN